MSLSMAKRSYPPPFDDEKLLKSTKRVIRRQGVRWADVDDVIQLVLMAVTKSTTMPTREPDRTKYLVVMTHHIAIDFANDERKRADRVPMGNILQGIAAPGATSPETIDFARRVHAAAVARDAQAAEWALRSTVKGEAQTAIAEEAGVPVDRVRQRISRLFAWVRENGNKLAMATLGLALLGLWGLSRREADVVSSPAPRGEAPGDRAAPLRSKAASECGAQMWRECLHHLDEARDIDPDGDTAPRVQAMRREAQAAIGRDSQPAPSAGLKGR
jgi:DNA-directed RNA polymerase specialized sigma24 family protein